jgi:hypothetical protein
VEAKKVSKRIVKLSVIRNQRKAAEAKSIRSDLFASARNITRDIGDDIGGFALIVWRRNGEACSAINNCYGPLRGRSLPSFCRDAISTHVTLDLMDVPSDVEDF